MYDSLDQFIINNLLSNKFQSRIYSDSKNSNDSKN